MTLHVRTGETASGAEHTATRSAISRDAAWLFAGYALTSGSGFVFWVAAAILIPQSALGVQASLLAIITAAAAFASIGPGSALIVLLPAGGPAAATVLSRALLVTAAAAVVAGTAAGALASAFLLTDEAPATVIALVALATVAWALFNVQTQALAGAGNARSTAWVNGAASVGKLVLLLGVAALAPQLPLLLVIATLVPATGAMILSATVLAPRAIARLRGAAAGARTWGPELARSFSRFTLQNTVATGLVLALGLSLSFLVTVLSSAEQGAVFALTYQVAVALDLVGVGVATSLARNASIDYDVSERVTRGLSGRVSLIVLGLGAVATGATPLLLSFLGEGYDAAQGAVIVAALAAASVLRPGYDLWSALMRARQRVAPVILGNVVWCAIVLAGCLTLVPPLGALGAALAILAGAVALAVFGLLASARTATRPPDAPVTPDDLPAAVQDARAAGWPHARPKERTAP
ncbi:hypothetical protein [Microbacterium rhizophilus]|uniref:hypothetical protein n=1 Tax=Microbacterium rhizophilus TaxID=3138934 RepID=UPI0031E57507